MTSMRPVYVTHDLTDSNAVYIMSQAIGSYGAGLVAKHCQALAHVVSL